MIYNEIMDKELIERLEATMRRVMANKLSAPMRPIISEMEGMPRHSIIIGARGTGKTTLMLREASRHRSLYFSADDYDVPADGIYDIATEAFSLGYEAVFIDEVHFDSSWERALKSLYDKYEDRMIWASDSSSLRLRTGIGETARRYLYRTLPLMSFREYLHMRTGREYPIAEDPFSCDVPFRIDSDFLYLFEEYKREGFLPIFQAGDYAERLKDMISKTVSSDIPFFVPEIRSGHIRLMREVLRYLASGSVPRIETENLTRQWNISYEKLLQLLHVMEETGLVSIVPGYGDAKERFSRSKILLANPSAYHVLGGREGNLREALTVLAFRSRGIGIYASQKEEAGDFIVDMDGPVTIEVGGRKKRHKESDYVVRDNIDYPSERVIPLWHLAMMW